MSETLKDVRAALAEGKCLVAVCSDEAFGLVQSFTDSDPTPGAAGRPVFYWDHLDGLSATGGASVPPNTEEVMNALDYAGTFKKPARANRRLVRAPRVSCGPLGRRNAGAHRPCVA